ncbi:hypothetical protein LTR66_005533 [Elasticomyces elasticus]|nr:hypothetical protein LTR66_005533 [Elasticomyces elasticus]
MVGVTEWGLRRCEKVQADYNAESWEGLKPHFKRPEKRVGRIENDGTDGGEGAIGDKRQVPHWTS